MQQYYIIVNKNEMKCYLYCNLYHKYNSSYYNFSTIKIFVIINCIGKINIINYNIYSNKINKNIFSIKTKKIIEYNKELNKIYHITIRNGIKIVIKYGCMLFLSFIVILIIISFTTIHVNECKNNHVFNIIIISLVSFVFSIEIGDAFVNGQRSEIIVNNILSNAPTTHNGIKGMNYTH